MIRYALRCDRGHGFDGWFRSAEGFDALAASGQVACSVCGSHGVTKDLMAPAVPARDSAARAEDRHPGHPPDRVPETAPGRPADRPLDRPGSEIEAAMAALRRHVEATSDYVGADFAAQARAIHDGEAPRRSIYGEARLDEARKLVEDGIPIAPLPFRTRRKLS